MPQTANALFAAWLFFFGSAVGSFLNVVVYRLPAGKSLVRPGSHCPKCEHAIRWYHNVPIFGWIVLGGKCKDCGQRIAARYPFVEALTAVLFLVLGSVECIWHGPNLPGPHDMSFAQLFGIYGYHIALCTTLLTAALIEYDGKRVPLRLFNPALVVGLTAPAVWPWLHPVRALPGLEGQAAGVFSAVLGLVFGSAAGWICWRVCGSKTPGGIVPALACLGLFLGWQAAFCIAAVVAILFLPLRMAGFRSILPVAIAAAATVGWILGWGWLVGLIR